MTSLSEQPRLTLRISGLGHSLTMREFACASVADLQSRICDATGIPCCYQRLLARGLTLDNGQATLEEVGLKDRTKILLLHSPEYAKEKDAYEMLLALEREINGLADQCQGQGQSMQATMVSEMVTRICCKLDAVDTVGSANLRTMRKELIRRAEQLEQEQANQQDAS
jgi:BAG domain